VKIALVSTVVPFVKGGARNIVDWLHQMLLEHGHQVEIVNLPQVDAPWLLFDQMMAFRWIDLSAADRIICFRPQAHLIRHHHKILWFIHHLRGFYDLWDSPYRGFPADPKHCGLRSALQAADSLALKEARLIFTNSQVVSDRLLRFNAIPSEVLYPPVYDAGRFYSAGMNEEIVCICRLEHHKRQHLLVEAMAHTRTSVRLRLCGTSSGSAYPSHLKNRVHDLGLKDRVRIDDRWIREEEKVELLAGCLAAAYLPLDEDSYGYPSLEASHSCKPLLTTTDSGAVLELVHPGYNGFVVEPDPRAIAEAMDRFHSERQATLQMGRNALARLSDLKISWNQVLDRLLV
jgi:glycosyltransferase involved in cell wall biosynthesis